MAPTDKGFSFKVKSQKKAGQEMKPKLSSFWFNWWTRLVVYTMGKVGDNILKIAFMNPTTHTRQKR